MRAPIAYINYTKTLRILNILNFFNYFCVVYNMRKDNLVQSLCYWYNCN